MRSKSNLYRKEMIYGFLFVLPPVIGFAVFGLFPALYSIYGAFTDWDGLGRMDFIGLANFRDIFQDEQFFKAAYNTFFLMIGIPIGLALALLLALALNRGIP
jgi:multiple sugar transport system permease protein